MPAVDVIIYIILLFGAVFSYMAKKLTLPGAITGAMVGLLIYEGAGLTGVAMLALFFIAGSWATSWKGQQNVNVKAIENHGPRTAGQVLANGGVAAILCALALSIPGKAPVLQLMVAGSLAAASADTLSSELGMIYGRRFYNIVTLKKDTRGLDGVVSLEGTLIGLFGAVLIAVVYTIGVGWNFSFWAIITAGFIGNTADSVLGATAERRGLIGNNAVNFLNTAIGAGVCWLMAAF
ncbi:DUF92 domain-containing protein [Mucilaginibacter antarcticus]|uniref:DUF92 domain-containing protein n=1 Tax=Mucilaginibacter antarcticus TaxID=1855725 RepID=A0ABW5XSB4_9SPHI